MEALVITGVGAAYFKSVQPDFYGVPPREFKFYRAPAISAGFFERHSSDEPIIMPVGFTRLPIHRVGGGGLPIQFAYWPENWLDDWGLKEVCKYFNIDVKDEDYGASGYFVTDPDDLGIRPVPGAALQWSETSSTGHAAISQGRSSLHPGYLLSDERDETS